MKIRNDEIVFSVVIPLYNKERYILNTLNSVLNQRYKNFEIVIVNDGSTDNSYDLVKQINDARIKLFSIENSGASEARNHGINKSTGTYIALLDADDCWQPNHLSNFFNTICKFPEQVIFCNNYKIKLSDNKIRIPRYKNLKPEKKFHIIDDFFESSLYNSIATSSTTCVKRDLLINYPYDTHIKSGQDTDLWIRLALKNSYVFSYKVTTIIHKDVENSLSISDNSEYRFRLTQKFLKQEKANLSLKKFMDINRFSVFLKCQYKGDLDKVLILKSQIDKSNLNKKQKMLMNLPGFILKNLFKIKTVLAQKGWLDFSIFN